MKFSSRALSGWRTGKFNISARTFTGEGVSLRSRPLGLSGWVTTATTEKFMSLASFSRLAQESSAVPMKIIRRGAIGDSLLHAMTQNVGQHLDGRLVGIDAMDEVPTVKFQDRLGLVFIDMQPVADHAEVRIVKPAVLDRAALDTGDEVFLGGRFHVKDRRDIERVFKDSCLLHVAGNAIKHERVGFGVEATGLYVVLDKMAPQFNGRLVGHELAAPGVFNKRPAQRTVRPQIAEHIAAGTMEKIGNHPDDFTLGAFAHTGGAKEKDAAVFKIGR